MIRIILIFCAAASLSPTPLAAESAYNELLKSAPEQTVMAPDPMAVAQLPAAPAHKAEGIGLSHSGDPSDIPNFSLSEVATMLRQSGITPPGTDLITFYRTQTA